MVEAYAVSFRVTLHYFQECMISESQVREEAQELEIIGLALMFSKYLTNS